MITFMQSAFLEETQPFLLLTYINIENLLIEDVKTMSI